MRARHWNKILIGLTLAAPVPYVAYAEIYLTEQQAANILFPGVVLKSSWIDLTSDEIKAIQKNSGERVLTPHVRTWWGPNHEVVIIDRVLGKHEYITYAVAISAEGEVKGVEIIEYRETYGGEIREVGWRKKFVGKTLRDPLKIDKDIPNISGATLSSVHITNGVRRLLHTYEILKTKI